MRYLQSAGSTSFYKCAKYHNRGLIEIYHIKLQNSYKVTPKFMSLLSKSCTNPCSWFFLLETWELSLYSLSPRRYLHSPAGLYIVCNTLLYHFSLWQRKSLLTRISAFFISADVLPIYTFNVVQLRHRLLHHWTVSTPASAAGNVSGDTTCTLCHPLGLLFCYSGCEFSFWACRKVTAF